MNSVCPGRVSVPRSRDPRYRVGELGSVQYPVLEQVADRARAIGYRRDRKTIPPAARAPFVPSKASRALATAVMYPLFCTALDRLEASARQPEMAAN